MTFLENFIFQNNLQISLMPGLIGDFRFSCLLLNSIHDYNHRSCRKLGREYEWEK